MNLTFAPLSPDRWSDLEKVFASKGCSFARNCWCMEYRLGGKRPALVTKEARPGENRKALKALVDNGHAPGLLAYHGTTPVGWVSLAPREEYARLKRSPVMKAIDDQPVWSIICFVVPSEFRGKGVATFLLRAAMAYAKAHGAEVVEAYPIDKSNRSNDGFMWFGAKSMYDKAGFIEAARPRPERPVVRLKIG